MLILQGLSPLLCSFPSCLLLPLCTILELPSLFYLSKLSGPDLNCRRPFPTSKIPLSTFNRLLFELSSCIPTACSLNCRPAFQPPQTINASTSFAIILCCHLQMWWASMIKPAQPPCSILVMRNNAPPTKRWCKQN
jgi:hypothetical protein